MAIPVEMPKMSDTMEEGVLVAWLVEEGSRVSAGDVIAQVETDKATMDLEVYDDGVLLKKVIGEGDAVPIGGLIAVLGEQGEDVSQILSKYGSGAGGDGQTQPEERVSAPALVPAPEPLAVGGGDGHRLKVSPLARRMASERNLDLRVVRGTGTEGRIIKRDIEAALEGRVEPVQAAPQRTEVSVPRPPAPAPAGPAVAGGYDALPISQMRKTIARRLAESKFTAPHFYLTVDADMEQAVQVRARINEITEARNLAKVSYNDLVIKACAMALRQHPAVNASYLEKEGEIRRHHDVHVGVAVAVEEGLLTPVVRHADRKGLAGIAEEVRSFAERARDKKLQPQDWEGSTFTTSNLGMFGIEQFTAIINPPNACILAIGGIRDVPVVKNGAVVPGKRMSITLSCDHRVVDGATGARFLATVKSFLEEPSAMLI